MLKDKSKQQELGLAKHTKQRNSVHAALWRKGGGPWSLVLVFSSAQSQTAKSSARSSSLTEEVAPWSACYTVDTHHSSRSSSSSRFGHRPAYKLHSQLPVKCKNLCGDSTHGCSRKSWPRRLIESLLLRAATACDLGYCIKELPVATSVHRHKRQ